MDEPVGLLLGTSATQQAYGAMYQTLVRQATLLAYIDNFRLLAFICLLCLPAGFLFAHALISRKDAKIAKTQRRVK